MTESRIEAFDLHPNPPLARGRELSPFLLKGGA